MNVEPLRVLFVHHSSDLYGSSRCMVRLLEKLDRTKFTPMVALAETGPLCAMIEKLGVEIVFQPKMSVITRSVFKSWRLFPFLFMSFPLSVWQTMRLIRNKEIDLVHTNCGVILSGALAAKLCGVPHVWHIREWFQEFKSFWPLYSRYIIGLSERVVNVSAAVAKQFPPSPKVVVIHDGYDQREFALPKDRLREDFRRQFNLGSSFVVGCVGRIKFVRKGQEILVQAAALLKQKGLAITCLIVGAPFTGNEQHLADLKKLVSDLHLDDTVVFTGELSDARPAYAAMDISVLPSAQPEPFGGVVIESMSMGVPIIATNIGGSPEMVADGKTGFLVPPSDPQALADKIEILIANANLRRQMAEQGPERVQANFSIGKISAQVENMYESIADKTHS